MKISSGTGYVLHIAKNDLEFEDAMLCFARAFGACVMQRDDSMADPPKLPMSDLYHEKALKKAEKALEDWNSLSIDEKMAWAKNDQEKELRVYDNMFKEDEEVDKEVKKYKYIKGKFSSFTLGET